MSVRRERWFCEEAGGIARETVMRRKLYPWGIPHGLMLLLLGACAAQGQTPLAATMPAAGVALDAHLAAMANIKTLQADFVCEKDLAMLESPLVSHGTLVIAKPQSVRFSTHKPYVSELILHDGKVLQKSQHETEWTRSDQSTRPGLNAIMGQLAGWSVGNAGKIGEFYQVAWAEKPLPPVPGEKQSAGAVDTFLLTPTNADLLKVIKEMRLAFDAKSHQLLAVRFITQPGDTTTYWFSEPKIDGTLPADVFAPKVN